MAIPFRVFQMPPGAAPGGVDPLLRARLLAAIDEMTLGQRGAAQVPRAAAARPETPAPAGGDTAALMDAVIQRALAEAPGPRAMTRGVPGPSLPPATQTEPPPMQASSGGGLLGTLLPILGVAGITALIAGAAADRRKTRRVGSTVYKGRNVPADILSVLGLGAQTVVSAAAAMRAKAEKKTTESEEARREGLKWLLQYGGLRPEEFAASYFGGVPASALSYAPREDPEALGKLVGSATFRDTFGADLQSKLLSEYLGTAIQPGQFARQRDPLMSGVARTVLGSTKAPEKAKQAVADWVAGTIDDTALAARLAAVPPTAGAGAKAPPMSEAQARMWVVSGAPPDLVQKIRVGSATPSEYLGALRQIADKQGMKDAYAGAARKAQLAFNLGVMGGMDNPVVTQLTQEAFGDVTGATRTRTPDEVAQFARDLEAGHSELRGKYTREQAVQMTRDRGFDPDDPEIASTIEAIYGE